MSIKESNEKGVQISISTYLSYGQRYETEVAFSLPHRDWCEVERSKEWVDFQNLLLEAKNKHNN